MRNWRLRILLLVLLAVIVGVPVLLRPHHSPAQGQVGAADKLVIVSPHNEQIRSEFARSFNAWRARQNPSLPPIEFDWRSSGGTSDLRKQVLAEFTNEARRAIDTGGEVGGIGYDLFFGGGDFEHNNLAKPMTVEHRGRKITFSLLAPVDFTGLPLELLEMGGAADPSPPPSPGPTSGPATQSRPAPAWVRGLFDPPDIGGDPARGLQGSPLVHQDTRWVGVCLSSFGIVFNRDVLAQIGRPDPLTWADLAHPGFRGWIALADPAHSGSVAVTYHTIVRRVGWSEGWAMLRRVFANARYFTNSAHKVPVDVSAGEAAAGMCIDFYGRFQAGAVGGRRVGYVDPAGMTAITADPISIFHGAPSPQLARQFVFWLLTREAQGLWQRRLGAPGGPGQFELRRLPIRRDMYQPGETTHWADPEVRPFDIARPFPAGTPDYYRLVAPLAHAMAIDIHDDLRAAWRALCAQPQGPARDRMQARFDALPEELTIRWPDAELSDQWATALADPQHPRHRETAKVLADFVAGLNGRFFSKTSGDALEQARLRWTLFFRDNYRKVAAGR